MKLNIKDTIILWQTLGIIVLIAIAVIACR
jgi:hypothetical protein